MIDCVQFSVQIHCFVLFWMMNVPLIMIIRSEPQTKISQPYYNLFSQYLVNQICILFILKMAGDGDSIQLIRCCLCIHKNLRIDPPYKGPSM